MRLLFVTDVDQALEKSPADVQSLPERPTDLTAGDDTANLPPGAVRREPTEGSAFWPEIDPRTRQQLLDKGYGEEVELAERISPELKLAVNKGFPIPPALRERAVFEVYRVMMASGNARDRLRAVEVLERMARANDNPNALPDQLNPGTPQHPSVQVNIQNNVSAPAEVAKDGSVTVAELVNEMLSRTDVQAALDADVPNHGEDYGI